MKIGRGRERFATKCGPGVETAHCLVKIVNCMGDNDNVIVPGVGPGPLLVVKSGLV